MKNNMLATISQKMNMAGLQIQKHSPEILFVCGVLSFAGTIAATYMAASHAEEILEKHKERLAEAEKAKQVTEEEPEQYEYDEDLYLEDRRNAHLKMAVDFGKTFAPVAGLSALSLCCFFSAVRILNNRYTGAVAAFNAVTGAFATYRKRVIDEHGEIWDRHYMYGTELEAVDVTDVDENGKKHKHKEVVEHGAPNKELAMSMDATCRFLDSSNKEVWDPNPSICMMNLRTAQNFLTDRLNDKGHLFLNEVYEYLGFPQTPEGALLGWISKDRNAYVDLGFGNADRDQFIRDFINGYNDSLMLKFNYDGIIWDRI